MDSQLEGELEEEVPGVWRLLQVEHLVNSYRIHCCLLLARDVFVAFASSSA